MHSTIWYGKAEMLINQINKLSKKLYCWPRYAVSIDEMMKVFKGRSIHEKQTE